MRKQLRLNRTISPGRRWVELIDLTDSINVLDENGEAACKITRGEGGTLVFIFRDGTDFFDHKFYDGRVEVPLK